MAQNKTLNIPPIAVPNTVGNLLNCAISSLAGPVGYTQTQPYLILKHIRAHNKTNAPVSLTLYKGATGASAPGTEFAFAAVPVPANSYLDWVGLARFDAADFLTGVAGSASAIVLEIDGEIGLS